MTEFSSHYPFKLQDQDQSYYILNSLNLTEIAPKSFHSTKDLYRPDRMAQLQSGALNYLDVDQQIRTFCTIPSNDGLESLNMSGSAQFTCLGFEWILAQIQQRGGQPSSLINIDLREESHCFVKGAPISHYIPGNCLNFGVSNREIEARERQWIDDLRHQPGIQIKVVLEKSDGLFKNTDTIILENYNSYDIVSEKDFIEKTQGYNYVRIPIGDHTKPTDEDMIEILDLFSKVDNNQWLHFHCAGGKGRTTTLMVLYDIFINHERNPNLTLEDYVLRHYLIGGINLFARPVIHWKADSTMARAQFIRQFHQKLY
ncbi:MAG: hypothetical protein ACRYGR_05040 [Janthinobacterium lividum]